MTKITIVTCIIAAVCVFQTAEAGFLPDPKSMVNSLLDNVPKVPNPLGNPLGNIKDLEDKIKNGLPQVPQKELQIPGLQIPGLQIPGLQIPKLQIPRFQIPECVNALYNQTRNAGKELTLNFSSCVSNKMNSVRGEVQELRNAVNKLRENLSKELSKEFQNLSNCFGNNVQNPLEITTCIRNIPNDISKIFSDLRGDLTDIVNKTFKLIGFFPEIGKCYEKAIINTINDNSNIPKDARICFISTIKSILPF